MNTDKINLYNKIIVDYNTGNFKLKELSLKYHIKYDTISKNIRKMGILTNPHGKISLNSDIFEKIDTEQKAYWLGFLYADGSVYKDSKGHYRFELGLQQRDLEHIQKFKKFINSRHKISYRENTKSYRISFNDSKFCNDLITLGCVPKKSLILKFPTEAQVPKKLIRHFIRGYFDGDGYLSKPPKQLTLDLLGTEEFLDCLLTHVDSTKKTLKKDKRHLNNTFKFSLCGNNARNFLKFIYKDAIVFLERKKELYNNLNLDNA
jgi:DNA-binding transcriptional regulator WhiA